MPSRSQGKATRATNSKGQASQTASTASPLQWPLLRPLVPATDLCLENVLEDQVIVIHNLFTATLCKSYVSFFSTLPLTTTPARPKEGDAVRVNDRIEFNDPGFAENLWKNTALESLVKGFSEEELRDENVSRQPPTNSWGGNVVGLSPRIRIYRYKEGQFFAPHYDDSNTMVLSTIPPTPVRTTWTLLIYLSGPVTGCIGGETVFYPELSQAKKTPGKHGNSAEPVVVGLEVGMALLHKHGRDCLLHEGRRVAKGEKWVIRSDLCVRK